jgi:hypothetical protein
MENPGLGPQKWLTGMAIALLLVFLPGTYAGAYPTPTPVTTDLWDISQGITIGATSGAHPNSLIGYMFGQDWDQNISHSADPTGVGGVTLRGVYQATDFSDNYDANNHFVEWSTASAVTVGSFNLFAFGPSRPFDRFTLEAKDSTGNWITLYNQNTSQYVNTYDVDWGGTINWLSLSVDIATPMEAQYYRAEFHGSSGGWGPRVVELDGFAVPLPGSLLLLGSGLLGMGAWRRFRKR